ncbi:PKD domain-containing protein [Rhodocaloribacter litoris]|uniref:PKD domain-containing protein n=1 Tax=Rhodocaloribacter litoris TaxID=2558931 RepID=UPI00141F0FAE|nr:PKD domain-containing protein [Rhodocaloribacter litoris]QXD16934.1 PKD domain-containing protein [Rhodocaloribacter litoris]
MRRRTGLSFLLSVLFLVAGGEARAQPARMDETLFIRPRLGLSAYAGDNATSLLSLDGVPYSLGLELGYQRSPRLSLGLGLQLAGYPGIHPTAGRNDGAVSTTRTSVHVLARHLLAPGNVAPYVHAGAHVTFGRVLLPETDLPDTPFREKGRVALGPLIGLGLDVRLNQNVSLFFEVTDHLTFPDEGADGRRGGGPFDHLLNTIGAGLKINFKRPFVPAVVGAVRCPPGEVQTGQLLPFSAWINPDATRPVSMTWDFGDGAMATGLAAAHTYRHAGIYTVTVVADNGRRADTATCTVVVVPACLPAEITAMTASNRQPDTRTAVHFAATVPGSRPVAYHWDFGDGHRSTEAAPTHTFAEAGTYTVTLEVTNCGGTVRRTMQVTVAPWKNPLCAVTAMNPVFFERNASILTEAARRQLRENLTILHTCPDLRARIEGFAAPDERNPDQLAEDRARVVEQFYVDNGIAFTRLTATGRGAFPGATAQPESANPARRVHTIPVRN